MDTIRAYATAIKAYRLSVKYVGEAQRGVHGHGTVPYDISGTYNVVSDSAKGMWKLEIHEERTPQGKMDEDDFRALYARESRTISKTRDGTIEYLHKDLDFGNYAVLYGQHQGRESAFQFQMQTLDPMRYVMVATRNAKCELIDVVQQDGGHVVITYRIKGDNNMLKRVELSKEYGFLPVRIVHSSGETVSDIALTYIQGQDGPVVKAVTYVKKSGHKGTVEYTSAEYNPEIPDAEFNVDIPIGAMVLDHEGRVLAHYFDAETAMSELLDKSITELTEGGDTRVAANDPATQNSTGAVPTPPEPTAPSATTETRKDAGGSHYGMWITIIVLLCVGGTAIGLLTRRRSTRSL
jgi:hypothetical protein